LVLNLINVSLFERELYNEVMSPSLFKLEISQVLLNIPVIYFYGLANVLHLLYVDDLLVVGKPKPGLSKPVGHIS